MTNTNECSCPLCIPGELKNGITKFVEFLHAIYGRNNVMGIADDMELVVFIYDHSVYKSILLSFSFAHKMLFAMTKEEEIYAWEYSLPPGFFLKYDPEDGSTTNESLTVVEIIELIGDKESMNY